jgi:hypothetical protein
MMCDVEQVVSYLYDELPADQRAAFEQHLAGCADCQHEVRQLRQTRVHLASWAPPEPDFGFRIVRGGAAAAPGRVRSLAPWGLAAAAALVLAASAAIANLEIQYGQDGLVVRTGWASRQAAPVDPQPATAAAVPVSASSEQLRADLTLLDERLRQLETGASAPGTRVASAPRASDAELLTAVRRIIAESDTRRDNELKLRVAQLWKDIEAVRANDIVRYEQGLRQVQGLTDAELVRHRETLNYLYANVSRQR